VQGGGNLIGSTSLVVLGRLMLGRLVLERLMLERLMLGRRMLGKLRLGSRGRFSRRAFPHRGRCCQGARDIAVIACQSFGIQNARFGSDGRISGNGLQLLCVQPECCDDRVVAMLSVGGRAVWLKLRGHTG
jgi:hypothetical protein